MFDIFEQPWTLVGASIIVLFGMLTFRSIFPEKRSWWQWLLPVVITAAAFGTDYIVQTDHEKIVAVIHAGIKAVENEDVRAIEALLAENYSDSYHDSKGPLLADCQRELQRNLVEKNKKTGQLIKISGPKATATVFMLITFQKDSYIAQNFLPFLQIKVDISLQKQTDNTWLINRVEIRELNKQQTTWGQIR